MKKLCQKCTVVGQISFDDIWGQRKCVDRTFMNSEHLSVSMNGLRRYASAIYSHIQKLSCIYLDIDAKHDLDRILIVLKYRCAESVAFEVSGYSHIFGLEFSVYHTLCIIR